MKRILLLIAFLLPVLGAFAEVKDMTGLLKNADFSQQLEGWDVESIQPHFQFVDKDSTGIPAVECKQVDFRVSQTLEGLEDGYYLFQTNAFYHSMNYEAWLFANEDFVPLMTFLEDPLPESQAVDRENCFITPGLEWTDMADLTPAGVCYIPHSLGGGAFAFKGGRYVNAVLTRVEGGRLTIGLRDRTLGDKAWTVFANARLYFLGTEAGEVAEETAKMLQTLCTRAANAYSENLTSSYCHCYAQELREELGQAVKEVKVTADKAENEEQIRYLEDLFTRIYKSQEAYASRIHDFAKTYEQLLNEAMEGNVSFEVLYEYEEAYMAFERAYTEGTLDLKSDAESLRVKTTKGYKMIHQTDAISTPKETDTDAALYDLQGRRLQAVPDHGIYIQRGRKILK